MSNQDSEASRAFTPVDSDEEGLTLIREGVKSFSATVIWTKEQETVVKTYLTAHLEDAREILAWIPKKLDIRAFEKHLIQIGDKTLFFSISLPRANVFFKAEYIGHEQGAFRFKYPDKIFKVQRRKSFRLPIPDGYIVFVEFDDALGGPFRSKKKVIDISAGGLSFIAGIEEEAFFKEGQMLRNLTVKVRNKEIKCTGQVRHARLLPISSRIQGVKVGIQFEHIRPGDAQHIAGYVFEESRKYFSKFMS